MVDSNTSGLSHLWILIFETHCQLIHINKMQRRASITMVNTSCTMTVTNKPNSVCLRCFKSLSRTKFRVQSKFRDQRCRDCGFQQPVKNVKISKVLIKWGHRVNANSLSFNQNHQISKANIKTHIPAGKIHALHHVTSFFS